ncbi:hypothetical protein [Azospirillum brasilense]|uniref:hypothetical protein n=1 Tax=Azospirillum brasilense TaxID=192 RepID=UPI00190E3207|nr:hypothetical protein [Azospirillum brasilense]
MLTRFPASGGGNRFENVMLMMKARRFGRAFVLSFRLSPGLCGAYTPAPGLFWAGP